MAAISERTVINYILSGIAASSTDERGRIFEDLIIYIMSKVPGISIATRDTLNPFHSEEIDVVFWNDKKRDGFFTLPSVIVTEVKGWSDPVGAPALSEFAFKLRQRNESFGFFVALNGITGFSSNEPLAARDRIRSALREGIRIIVVTGEDLMSFRSGEDFVQFVKEKLCEIAASGTQVS